MDCKHCGKEIEGRKKSAKYCSDSCKSLAYQQRNGLPSFIGQRKTQPNPKRAKIANIIDRQDLKLQELYAKRNTLFGEYQKVLNKTPEYRGKLIGFGAGLYLAQKEDTVFAQLLTIAGMTAIGAIVDNTIQQPETTKQQKLNFIGYQILQIEAEIRAVEIASRQNDSILSSEPTKAPIQFENENLPEIQLPELVTVSSRRQQTKVGSMTLTDLNKQTFDTITLTDEYQFMGHPESNFYMALYGQPGEGKSTWAVNFAHYLSNNFGKVLYNSSEEGISKSLQNKSKDLRSQYLYFSNYRNFDDLKKEIEKGRYRFIFIDSINDMKITPEELQSLRNKFYKSGFVGILQSTKGGSFKGSNDFAHDCDIKIQFNNFQPIVEKNRYQ